MSERQTPENDAPRNVESEVRPARLPNGLTPAQDAAFETLARAWAEHFGVSDATDSTDAEGISR